MNKGFSKIVLIALTLLLLLTPLSVVYGAIPEPTDQFYVNDYANVIDSDIENLLVHNGNLLYQTNGAQIVLVTVDFVGSKSMEEYATELFNSWGIGSADKNNGLLILLSIGDDDYWVLQGKGLESSLKSSLISEYNNRYLEPDFAAQNYGEGAAKLYRAFTEYLGGTWSTDVGGNRGVDPSPGGGQAPGVQPPVNQPGFQNSPRRERGSNFLVTLFIFIVIIILISSNRRRYYRRRYGVPFNPFSRRRVRRYGPGGYWGRYGPPPMGGGFWYGGGWHTTPKPPPRKQAPPPPPPRSGGGGFWGGGGTSGRGGSGRPSGGSFWGSSSGGGGSSRGGGVGRSSSWGGFGSGGRSGGSFGGGRSFGGGGGRSFGGGGSSRGGGAGRSK